MATMSLCYSVKLLATWAAHIRGFAPVYETPQCFPFDLVKCLLLCFVSYQHCQCKEIFWTLFYYVRFYINAYYMSNSCKMTLQHLGICIMWSNTDYQHMLSFSFLWFEQIKLRVLYYKKKCWHISEWRLTPLYSLPDILTELAKLTRWCSIKCNTSRPQL